MYRTMLVDDEIEVAKALGRVLRRHGFTVEIAQNARQALEKLDAFSPEVVISDFLMPDMNGLELLKEVRERKPGVVRVMLTGYADMSGSDDHDSDDLCSWMPKPWDETALLMLLREKLTAPPNS